MSKRETLLDKTIKAIDDKIAGLMFARDEFIALRDKADLAAARPRPPKLKTVSK